MIAALGSRMAALGPKILGYGRRLRDQNAAGWGAARDLWQLNNAAASAQGAGFLGRSALRGKALGRSAMQYAREAPDVTGLAAAGLGGGALGLALSDDEEDVIEDMLADPAVPEMIKVRLMQLR